MNKKLLEYSLDLNICQSRTILQNHQKHLKMLSKIQSSSKIPHIIKQTFQIKHLSQITSKKKVLSRKYNFNEKSRQNAKQDIKMIRCLSQIMVKKQSLFINSEKQRKALLQRKQHSKKQVQQQRNRQLDQQNQLIAFRIIKTQTSTKNLSTIQNNIQKYQQLKNHIKRIKDDSIRNRKTNRISTQISRAKLSSITQPQHQQNKNIKSLQEISLKSLNQRRNTQYQHNSIMERGSMCQGSLGTDQIINLLNKKSQLRHTHQPEKLPSIKLDKL